MQFQKTFCFYSRNKTNCLAHMANIFYDKYILKVLRRIFCDIFSVFFVALFSNRLSMYDIIQAKSFLHGENAMETVHRACAFLVVLLWY